MGTVKYEGRDVETKAIDFTAEEEPYCVYELENGKKFKFRAVVTEITELVGEKNPQTGQPIHFINSEQSTPHKLMIPAELIPVDFETKSEPWITYALSDGKTLKFRCTLSELYEVQGEKNECGQPIYIAKGKTAARVV